MVAPKVRVPMNFGRRLQNSPTHSTLKLEASEGKAVYASSVILSFNSPLIDFMTTDAHMTSVDVTEFSEEAVRVFVESAYSGVAFGINRSLFREVNKLAYALEVTWLQEKCWVFFNEIVDTLSPPISYGKLIYLFEEACFSYAKLKRKNLFVYLSQEMAMKGWKQQFLDRYLENSDRLSNEDLDMVIEFAGAQVNCVVQTLTDQFVKLFKVKGSDIPVSSKYLLDNSKLFLCKKFDLKLFENLFDLLGDKLPDDKMKWALQLYRRSYKEISFPSPSADAEECVSPQIESTGHKRKRVPPECGALTAPMIKKEKGDLNATDQPTAYQSCISAPSCRICFAPSQSSPATSSNVIYPCVTHLTEKVSIPTASESQSESKECQTSSKCDKKSLDIYNNTEADHPLLIKNIYHPVEMNVSLKELLCFIAESKTVSNLLLAIELILSWNRYTMLLGTPGLNCIDKKQRVAYLTNELKSIAASRGWKQLPKEFIGYSFKLNLSDREWINFDLAPFCSLSETNCYYTVISSLMPCGEPICFLSMKSKIPFKFKHPSVNNCDLPGHCGFILETFNLNQSKSIYTRRYREIVKLLNIRLCTDEKDYKDQPVHYHPEIDHEKMHLYFINCNMLLQLQLFPVSWIGRKSKIDWTDLFGFRDCVHGVAKVLYELDKPVANSNEASEK